ncbi:MAG: TonB-dependent receptor [Verrucomicrobiales bacterium]
MEASGRRVLPPEEKALAINLDGPPYGTLAEIGGGQEVANRFFRVGAASGTIVKTISAYDMTFSDSIYGPTRQYVSRGRLKTMLDHEFSLLVERLDSTLGERSTFFAFGNTVRVRAYGDTHQECHGWMGVQFQIAPRSPAHDVLVHVRLFDDALTEQQDALGLIGLNLIYAALYLRDDLRSFTESLRDNVKPSRAEIDFLKFHGPSFAGLDNRLCALQLVESGLTPSAFFTARGEVMQASEAFYKAPLLLLRGRFDPVTNVHLDMLESAGSAMRTELADGGEGSFVEIMELSMNNLLETEGSGGSTVTPQIFLHRADMLQALGKNVLVSRYAEFHRLGAFLSRYTQKPVGIVLSVSLLAELFEEKWYANLEGGLLESFGRLFKNAVRLYVYPELHPGTGQLRSAAEVEVAPHLRKLFEYLLENRFIVPLLACHEEGLQFSGPDIRAMIAKGDPRWTQLVPAEVVQAMTAAQCALV